MDHNPLAPVVRHLAEQVAELSVVVAHLKAALDQAAERASVEAKETDI